MYHNPSLFCAADDVMDNIRDRFITRVDANAIVHGLEHANIISGGDLIEIKKNPDARQQSEILHRCLKRSCDEEALMEVCDMMIAVRGNRKMNSLGKEMKHQLEKGIFVEHACVFVIQYLCTVQVYACMCACVHLWVWLGGRCV